MKNKKHLLVINTPNKTYKYKKSNNLKVHRHKIKDQSAVYYFQKKQNALKQHLLVNKNLFSACVFTAFVVSIVFVCFGLFMLFSLGIKQLTGLEPVSTVYIYSKIPTALSGITQRSFTFGLYHYTQYFKPVYGPSSLLDYLISAVSTTQAPYFFRTMLGPNLTTTGIIFVVVEIVVAGFLIICEIVFKHYNRILKITPFGKQIYHFVNRVNSMLLAAVLIVGSCCELNFIPGANIWDPLWSFISAKAGPVLSGKHVPGENVPKDATQIFNRLLTDLKTTGLNIPCALFGYGNLKFTLLGVQNGTTVYSAYLNITYAPWSFFVLVLCGSLVITDLLYYFVRFNKRKSQYLYAVHYICNIDFNEELVKNLNPQFFSLRPLVMTNN